MSESRVTVTCTTADAVNVAFYQNAIPIVRELAIENTLGRDLQNLQVRVSSEPPFLAPGLWRVERIANQTVHHIRPVDLKLDGGFLSGLTVSRRAEARVVVECDGARVAEHVFEITLLPPSHWGGMNAAPELLAAFVRPTDPSVDVILREASDKLAQAGRNAGLDGYREGRKVRSWEIAEAIWTALAGHAIAYVLPPKSFERAGQMLRGPGDVLTRQVGTCLDLTLLYAACLEQAGLNPLLVLTEGHAFVGLWLADESFSTAIVDDAQMLRKRVQLQDMILVETTLLTGQSPARFKQAVAQGGKQIAEDALSRFELAIDVNRARIARVRPLELDGGSGPSLAPDAAPVAAQTLEEAPAFEDDLTPRAAAPDKTLDRLETWKRKLLDLTLRNRLLNFKDSKSTIPLECPDPALLEDMLSAGARFQLHGRSVVLDGDGRDAALFAQRLNEDGRRDFILGALARSDLHTNVGEDVLEARLTELYRAARLAFEEGGANILYLCIGFLKWTPKEGAGPYRAPLLLLPVRLERKSVRSGFRLALHDDEIRFNPTLLQLLRQDFDLALPQFDGELPGDEKGVDVAAIWTAVRRHIKAIKGWEVTEHVVLSTLSFTKYLMWKDLVDRTADLKRNAVVRHLIDTPTHTYDGSSGAFVAPEEIDAAVDPADLFTPLSADSSQIAAIVAAQHGKDFVLFGPPGTGKSQSITNMVANCLAHGKSVLFVSQKTAALQVVRRRLQDVGLGSYCLEVHSTKAQKASVLEQLKLAWSERARATETHWSDATAELRTRRDQLNALVSALHRRRENGMTAYEAFGRVVADRDRLADVGLAWPAGTAHTPQQLAAMRAMCGELTTALKAIGDPSVHPLRGVEQTRWTPAWVQDLLRLIATFQPALLELRRATEAFAAAIAVPADTWDFADLPQFTLLAAQLMKPEAADAALLLGDDASERIRTLRAMSDVLQRTRAKIAELGAEYDLGVTRLDLRALQADWAEACASNFLFRSARQNKVRLTLAPYAKRGPAEDLDRDLVVLQDVAALLGEAETLRPAFADMERLWRGVDTDEAAFETMMVWAEKTRAALRAFGARSGNAEALRAHVIMLLSEYGHLFGAAGEARQTFQVLQSAWRSVRSASAELVCCIGLDPSEPLLQFQPGRLEELIARTDRWKGNTNKAPQWATWRAAAHAARGCGLDPLVDAVEEGRVPGHQIVDVFEFAYARWVAETIVNDDACLSGFLAERHDACIEAFVAADKKVCDLAKQIVRARIGGTIPTQTNFGKDPEWGTLAREISKKARHMPLRSLFGRIPTVLTQLAPCVMMSPLSIAQYLPPDAKPFDVVIFDEASQIPVWDAIGAIARGTQVVIVGDPEQLPPTSVGQRAADEPDMDDGVVESQQSILDECLASNIPSMRLSWHYRSRHESLIAFSNAKYYRGELVTFPSPVTRDDAVRYVHVEGGVYERGGARVNRKEAEAVVADVVRRLRSAKESIGVVTFNGEQQRLIENLLDQARRSDPSLERHFDRTQTTEPIFIKNIENVQGDERDVIIFVAVGPDQTGRVTAQISSLNGEGGHRRLNVAVTRARRELAVFATLRPEQIDLGRTGARGVVDFKHFLEFAQSGVRAIAESFAPTGRDVESPFEEAVMRALEARGWVVHPQVGVSCFRVDLGVVHPDYPGRYLAGVECDGATYHRSATARDRDRLREMVLTGLGWRIRRIWSTEWWMDGAAALEKIHARLVADLEEDRRSLTVESPGLVVEEPVMDDEAEAAAVEESVPVEPVSAPAAPPCAINELPEPMAKVYARAAEPAAGAVRSPAVSRYEIADPASVFAPEAERFYDADYLPRLRAMADHVVAVEGPIYFDVLVTRVSRAHGFQRAKDLIRGAIRSALGEGRFATTIDGEREIIWPQGLSADKLPDYRESASRPHVDIPLPELASLAARLRSPGCDDEGAVRRMQDHFGLGRLAAATRERFKAALQLLLERS
ncbi:MAG: DUF3320 domain-containing protein [Beijerinckiaceae bacterium]|nr:DUF3320 domain-containing protein [Beijerinckiaceae bacterium]